MHAHAHARAGPGRPGMAQEQDWPDRRGGGGRSNQRGINRAAEFPLIKATHPLSGAEVGHSHHKEGGNGGSMANCKAPGKGCQECQEWPLPGTAAPMSGGVGHEFNIA